VSIKIRVITTNGCLFGKTVRIRGMRIDAAGYPFILGALVLALFSSWVSFVAGVALLLLAAFFLFFFRDPDRTTVVDINNVLAPADGRVMVAGHPTGKSPPGKWKQVSIFLSPIDVHVNRIPYGGKVTHLEYHPGKFLPAYRSNAGDLNEYTEIWLAREGVTVVMRQIVGVLARRIVCRVKVGDNVQSGDRFGIMKFGSRMDLFLPHTAKLLVSPKDKVIGGISVLAHLEEHEAK